MRIDQLTDNQKERIVVQFRKALKAQHDIFDAVASIEKITGCDFIDAGDLLETIVVGQYSRDDAATSPTDVDIVGHVIDHAQEWEDEEDDKTEEDSSVQKG